MFRPFLAAALLPARPLAQAQSASAPLIVSATVVSTCHRHVRRARPSLAFFGAAGCRHLCPRPRRTARPAPGRASPQRNTRRPSRHQFLDRLPSASEATSEQDSHRHVVRVWPGRDILTAEDAPERRHDHLCPVRRVRIDIDLGGAFASAPDLPMSRVKIDVVVQSCSRRLGPIHDGERTNLRRPAPSRCGCLYPGWAVRFAPGPVPPTLLPAGVHDLADRIDVPLRERVVVAKTDRPRLDRAGPFVALGAADIKPCGYCLGSGNRTSADQQRQSHQGNQ